MIIILSMVLLTVAVVSIVFCLTNSFSHPWLSLIAFIIFVTSLIIGLGLYQPVHPTKQDVLDGKAIYQKTQIITGNDTIKTYDIVWKQKN